MRTLTLSPGFIITMGRAAYTVVYVSDFSVTLASADGYTQPWERAYVERNARDARQSEATKFGELHSAMLTNGTGVPFSVPSI